MLQGSQVRNTGRNWSVFELAFLERQEHQVGVLLKLSRHAGEIIVMHIKNEKIGKRKQMGWKTSANCVIRDVCTRRENKMLEEARTNSEQPKNLNDHEPTKVIE